jgi:hypothetical protein
LVTDFGSKSLWIWKRIEAIMRSNSIIYILFICVMLASSMICLAENTTSASAANLTVPKEMLPEGFKLLAVLPEMDPNVNMTEYISDFYGAEDIGPAAVTVGIFSGASQERPMMPRLP